MPSGRAALALLLLAASPVRAPAQSPTPNGQGASAPRGAPPSGLGWDVSVAAARGSDGGVGDQALSGHALVVARNRWLGRWFRLRTPLEYQDLRRPSPSGCAPACPPFESRRRMLGTALELSVHVAADRWHAYPIAGIGAAYLRSTGGPSQVGVTRTLGVGLAVPAPGGWPTLALEARVVRVPHERGRAWHLPVAAVLRF